MRAPLEAIRFNCNTIERTRLMFVVTIARHQGHMAHVAPRARHLKMRFHDLSRARLACDFAELAGDAARISVAP